MINLLPPKEKEELLAQETKRLTLTLVGVISLSLACLIIILVFLKIYLSIQTDFQRENLELIKNQAENPQAQVVREEIENLDQKLKGINDFYEQKINLAEVSEKLVKTIPKGIYLADFSYFKTSPQGAKTSSRIILAGFSPSRELLRQFKNNLEEIFQTPEGEPERVYFPPSTWAEPVNINFTGVQINLIQ